MAWIAAAIGGGAVLNYLGSQRAAGAQADAANHATDVQLQMYNQTRADTAPWRTMGTDVAIPGMTRLMTQPGTFAGSPGYDFRFNQGLRALTNSAAARGGLLGGDMIKNAQTFGQGIASDEYMNEFNRYATMAGMGSAATNTQAGANMATGANVGNNLMQAGNARASGYMGGVNAINQGIGQGVNAYQWQTMMDRLYPQGGGTSSYPPALIPGYGG